MDVGFYDCFVGGAESLKAAPSLKMSWRVAFGDELTHGT